MKESEITAIARELADYLYNDDESYNSILWWGEEPKERKAEELEHTLRFLLRRYCLVEKKDVEAKYQEAKERYFNPDDEIEKTMYGGRMSMLEYLFPEIAKEVEG